MRETDVNDGEVEEVREFVEEQGDKMAYTVAMDDPVKKTVFDAWMTAGGSYGIPASYIVDQRGKMVWVGHPNDIDKPLAQVLDGTLDVAAAQALQDERSVRTTQRLNRMKLMQPIKLLEDKKDYQGVIAEVDKVVAREPKHEVELVMVKLGALLHLDESKAIAFANGRAADKAFLQAYSKGDEVAYWSSVGGVIAGREGLLRATYQFAVGHLTRATANSQANFSGWRSLAVAHSRLGNFSAAIKAQQAAIAAAEKREYPQAFIARLKDTLAEYQNGKG